MARYAAYDNVRYLDSRFLLVLETATHRGLRTTRRLLGLWRNIRPLRRVRLQNGLIGSGMGPGKAATCWTVERVSVRPRLASTVGARSVGARASPMDTRGARTAAPALALASL